MKSGRGVAVAALCLALAIPAFASAQGGYDTEPTREQWVAEADAICKRPYARAEDQLRMIGPLTKEGKYKRAGKVLIGVANVVFDVNERVADLARPPADDAAISAYLKGERRGAQFALASGKALKHEKIQQAIKLLKRADRVQDRANENVNDFGLKHCI